MDQPGNLSLERRSSPPSLVGGRVTLFLVISASLGVLQSLLAIFLPQQRLLILSLFIPANEAFCLSGELRVASA